MAHWTAAGSSEEVLLREAVDSRAATSPGSSRASSPGVDSTAPLIPPPGALLVEGVGSVSTARSGQTGNQPNRARAPGLPDQQALGACYLGSQEDESGEDSQWLLQSYTPDSYMDLSRRDSRPAGAGSAISTDPWPRGESIAEAWARQECAREDSGEEQTLVGRVPPGLQIPGFPPAAPRQVAPAWNPTEARNVAVSLGTQRSGTESLLSLGPRPGGAGISEGLLPRAPAPIGVGRQSARSPGVSEPQRLDSRVASTARAGNPGTFTCSATRPKVAGSVPASSQRLRESRPQQPVQHGVRPREPKVPQPAVTQSVQVGPVPTSSGGTDLVRIPITAMPQLEIGPDGRYQLCFSRTELMQAGLQTAQSGGSGPRQSRGTVPARDTSHSVPRRMRSSSRHRWASPSREPLRWDYSDLSDATRGRWTSSEDLQRDTRGVAGLTGSTQVPTSQWTRELVVPAHGTEVREPVMSGHWSARNQHRQDTVERSRAEMDASRRPPCPFSPPVLRTAGPSQPRPTEVQGHQPPLFTASRFVPVSVPTTTLATTVPEAHVTWAQSCPRVVTAVSPQGGRTMYAASPRQANWAAGQEVCSGTREQRDLPISYSHVPIRHAPVQATRGFSWGDFDQPLRTEEALRSEGNTGWSKGSMSRKQDEAAVKPTHWGLVPSSSDGAACDLDIVPSPAISTRTAVQVEEPKYSNKSTLKPEKYDGKANWRDYRAQFEIVARVNDWSERTKASHLASSLRGPALEVLGDLPVEERDDFPLLIAALERRFGNKNQAELHKVQLKARVKSKNESYPEMAQAIRRLTREAYPRTDAATHEVLALDAFVDGISDDAIRDKVSDRKPADLDAAVKLAVEYEARKRADHLRGKGKHARVARAESDSEDRPASRNSDRSGKSPKKSKSKGDATAKVTTATSKESAELAALRKQVEKLADLVAQSQRQKQQPARGKPKSSKPKQQSPCYKCGELGHWANRCPNASNGSSQASGSQQGN